MPPMARLDLPVSVNLILITLHRHDQGLVFMVILELVKLTININYHS